MAEFTDIAKTIMEARYLRKDENGKVIETPEEMFKRVAKYLSGANSETYFEMMNNMDFLPNTPTLINAGRPNAQLSACFVLPIEDSMEGIFEAVKNAALIHKTGGGTGFSFSRIRSRGSKVSTTGGEASGVVSFLRVFNEATNSVKQGGVRRGANMGLLRIDHPDIEEFVMCKDDPTQLTNFNISVGVTNAFMTAVMYNAEWDLIDPHTEKVVKTVNAIDLWDMIIHQAWKNGEPGIIFLDEVNRHDPNPELGEIEATNPCGEQPLLPYESCNLGSINLSNHVTDSTTVLYSDGDLVVHINREIDYAKLEQTCKRAVYFLNDVLDHNFFPLPQIKECTLKTRKIGLGVMGFADMLIKLGVRYDSEEAEHIAERVMHDITVTANEVSGTMNFRNSTLTTIAPTGTISMLANVSSGIEPNFAWVYTRNACDTTKYIVHPLMEKKLKEVGQFNDHILSLLENGTPVKDIPELSMLGPEWVTSQEISPEWHIRIQAAFQKHTDNAVSKTINMPKDATEDDVSMAYWKAYHLRCKGITVYRDGSRGSQVLNHSAEKAAIEDPSVSSVKALVRPRPERVEGYTSVKKIGCGKLYVTVNSDSEGPIEIFTNTGKAGGCPAQSEGLARMVSLALRHGIPVEAISKQLCGIRCMSTIRKDGCDVLSCPDAIGKTLRESHVAESQLEEVRLESDTKAGDCSSIKLGFICPECGQPLELSEGCVICHSCGFSKCG